MEVLLRPFFRIGSLLFRWGTTVTLGRALTVPFGLVVAALLARQILNGYLSWATLTALFIVVLAIVAVSAKSRLAKHGWIWESLWAFSFVILAGALIADWVAPLVAGPVPYIRFIPWVEARAFELIVLVLGALIAFFSASIIVFGRRPLSLIGLSSQYIYGRTKRSRNAWNKWSREHSEQMRLNRMREAAAHASSVNSVGDKPALDTVAKHGVSSGGQAAKGEFQFNWHLPDTRMLSAENGSYRHLQRSEIQRTRVSILATLAAGKVENARIANVTTGPSLTTYQVERADGSPIEFNDRLASALKPTVFSPEVSTGVLSGIQVHNLHPEKVVLGGLINTQQWAEFAQTAALPIMLGKDSKGAHLRFDLKALGDILIANGDITERSFGLHSIVLSLLLSRSPDQLRLVIMGPRNGALVHYSDLPHSYAPHSTDKETCANVLNALGAELSTRTADNSVPLVVLIEELDMLLGHFSETTLESLSRLVLLGPKKGVYVVGSVGHGDNYLLSNNITAGFMSRISFLAPSRVASMAMINNGDAMKLSGAGDMLFLQRNKAIAQRGQSPSVTLREIRAVANYWTSVLEAAPLPRLPVKRAEVDQDAYFKIHMPVSPSTIQTGSSMHKGITPPPYTTPSTENRTAQSAKTAIPKPDLQVDAAVAQGTPTPGQADATPVFAPDLQTDDDVAQEAPIMPGQADTTPVFAPDLQVDDDVTQEAPITPNQADATPVFAPDLQTGDAVAQEAPIAPNQADTTPVFAPDLQTDDLAQPISVVGQPMRDLPDIGILASPTQLQSNQAEVEQVSKRIEECMRQHGVNASVERAICGPTITTYAISPGWKEAVRGRNERVRVDAILKLEKDLALELGTANIRFEAVLQGESAIGLEVPNGTTTLVNMRSVMDSQEWLNFVDQAQLPVAIGLGSDGSPVYADLTKMPHLLIAGSTGSGKSICVNSIITSLMLTRHPAEVRMVLVDPKRIELTNYQNQPHLMSPVLVEPKQAVNALKALILEMRSRFEILQTSGKRDIAVYNAVGGEQMAHIVVVVDELADLMMTSGVEVEGLLVRLAQLGRAAGIHLVVATQRPSVDIVTGLIKANFPSRICFAVMSSVDARTVLDRNGGEKLLGKGDMLFAPIGKNPERVQGVYLSDAEIEAVTSHWHGLATDHLPQLEIVEPAEAQSPTGNAAVINEDDDETLISQASELALTQRTLSVSLLQRRMRIGYPRAARLMDTLEENGVVGPGEPGKPRQVLLNAAA